MPFGRRMRSWWGGGLRSIWRSEGCFSRFFINCLIDLRLMKTLFSTIYREFLFFISPGERELLLALWHRRRYYRSIGSKKTAYMILDEALASMELSLSRDEMSMGRMQRIAMFYSYLK